MSTKRYKPEQVVNLLRQIEVVIANGKTTPQACRDAQIRGQTYYRWRHPGRRGQLRGGWGGDAEDPDDIPQILNMAVVYELPFGQGKPFLSGSGLGKKVFGGWKLVQNWNIQTGVPMVFGSPCNGLSCRPNLIGDPSRGRGSKTRRQLQEQWYDPSAFEAPFGSDPGLLQAVSTGFFPDGTAGDFNTIDEWWVYGNVGLHPPTGRAPGFWNADISLTKEVHLTESKYFQFRWDVFNALNHQNLGIPDNTWCLPPNPDESTDAIHIFGCQFGRITNVQTDPRAMQFAMKFFF